MNWWGYTLRLLLVLSMLTGSGGCSADFSNDPGAKAFIDEMVTKHGFDRQWLVDVMKSARRQPSILEAIARPAEKTLTWGEYRKIFLTRQRIDGGVAFWRANGAALERAHEVYGVAPEVIVAIIGVETRYGQHKGRYRVVDALSTLAFDYPPRSAFFRSELEQFLLLVREQGFDPLTRLGSYAGAMGYGQFIPSSYRHFAVDFDSDGKADIFDDPIDAIGSVAHYFQAHGWLDGDPVTVQVRADAGADAALIDGVLEPQHTVAAVQKAGYVVPRGIDTARRATLMKLEGEKGAQFWIGFHNFYVITRYNHSPLYAMAVWQLGKAIKQARGAELDAAN